MRSGYIMLGFWGLIVLTGCASLGDVPDSEISDDQAAFAINETTYKGYRAIDPLPVFKVQKYDADTDSMKDVLWPSISETKDKRALLPIQSSQVSVKKQNKSGKVSYLSASVAGEEGYYTVIMDYMKYRVEEVVDSSGKFIGNGRIGVGLRIKAEVTTSKKNVNLGSILALGVEAEQGNLAGGISVDVIGIDSEGVTNLIPMTSEIDRTAIQSALQALASVKAKMWENDVTITPHLVAITDAESSQEGEIRKQVTDSRQ